MVLVEYKFNSNGKRAKWFKQNVRTMKEANDIKKTMRKKGECRITRFRAKSKKRSVGGFDSFFKF